MNLLTIQKNDIIEVKIEKLLYEGKGLARVNNFPIFIENVCPDDIVKIQIVKINKGYAIGNVLEIVSPSKFRVKPLCALHNVCGSCNWLYIDYDEQLNQKRNIVKETLKNISGLDLDVNEVIPSPLTKEYRCKVQYPVAQTKVSKRLLAGYYKKNSHELINIKFCHLHAPIISEILEFIKVQAQNIGLIAYDEKKHSGILRHIIFRNPSDKLSLFIIFVINSNNIPKEIYKLSEIIKNKYPIITGISANFNTKKSNVILGNNTKTIYGDNFYIENLDGISYRISANSFFQVNPYCAKLIFNKVKEFIKNNYNEKPTVLDAYSGVSSFGIWLSDISSKVICVEEAPSSSYDAFENIKLNNISNVEIYNGDAANKFEEFIKQKTKFDVSIVDPPRKGCTDESINNLVKLTKDFIIYVSCNVSTLARDIKELQKHDYKPIFIQPFDMFPNTYHIETLAILKKIKKEAI